MEDSVRDVVANLVVTYALFLSTRPWGQQEKLERSLLTWLLKWFLKRGVMDSKANCFKKHFPIAQKECFSKLSLFSLSFT